MAKPFTEPAGKRRFIGQADRRDPLRRQFDGLEPHGRVDSAARFGGRWKRDRLELDSGGAETIQTGLIDGGLRLGLFRRRGVVWGEMRGRLGRAWTRSGRGPVKGRAGGLRQEGEHTGDYEKSATAHGCDAGPMRDLAKPPYGDHMLRAQNTRVAPFRAELDQDKPATQDLGGCAGPMIRPKARHLFVSE